MALGGGPGLACVLSALRGANARLTVITSITADEDLKDDAPRRLSGPVGDLRRSLEALSDEDTALLHAIRRPLSVEGVGQHPLGDLTLTAAADALGGYGRASMWLGDQLGVDGTVLPATIEPARHDVEEIASPATREGNWWTARPVTRLRFADGTTRSPEAAVDAIRTARWVVLTPGGLYRHILPTSAVPDLATALMSTSARVVWIANLAPDPADAAGLTATDQVRVLRLHGVRVDAVLYDPAAALACDASELAVIGVESVSRPLRSSSTPGIHDPELLHAALIELFATRPQEQPAA